MLGRVTQPDDRPLLALLFVQQRSVARSLAAVLPGAQACLPLAVRTCWITAVSSLELRSQAGRGEGGTGHQAETSGDTGSVTPWRRSTSVPFSFGRFPRKCLARLIKSRADAHRACSCDCSAVLTSILNGLTHSGHVPQTTLGTGSQTCLQIREDRQGVARLHACVTGITALVSRLCSRDSPTSTPTSPSPHAPSSPHSF